jgi:hypothetical protein
MYDYAMGQINIRTFSISSAGCATTALALFYGPKLLIKFLNKN